MEKQSLERLIDDRRLSPYQALVIGLCALVAILDGFDTQAVGFVAPLMAKAWAVPISTFGAVFAAGLLGSLMGAVPFGMVADRVGRRLTILVTVTIFALGSLMTAFTSSPTELMLCRLVTGLGLGGAMPSIIALAAEYAPARSRSTLVTAMFCGFPLGAVLGAIGSGPLIEAHGWQAVFWAGGIAPLAMLPIFVLVAPESIGWLKQRGERAAVEAILARLGRRDAWDGDCTAPSSAKPLVSLAAVFRQGRALGSALFAAGFFLSLLLVYLLVSWIPTVAVQAGHTPRASVMAAAVLNLAGIVGSLVIARTSDRFNPHGVVAAAYGIGALGALAFALSGQLSAHIFPFTIVAGLFCIGAQVSLISLGSAFYPVEVRGTGLGFLMSSGRVGAIVGPLAGALFIEGSHVALLLGCVVGAASLAACLVVLAAGWSSHRHSRRHGETVALAGAGPL